MTESSKEAASTSSPEQGAGKSSEEDRQKSQPVFEKVKLRNLWLIRAAIGACTLFLVAYAASLGVAIQGIQSVAQIAFDPEVESLLDQHLALIKKTHILRQETYQARLHRVIPQKYRNGATPTVKLVESWLKEVEMDQYVPIELIEIRPLSKEEVAEDKNQAKENPKHSEWVRWTDKSTLRLLQFEVSLPKDLVARTYKKAEELINRNRGIRATWHNTIQPTIIRLQILIVLGAVVLFGAGVFFFFRKFKKEIDRLVEGFSIWSEEDSRFRFQYHWTGELKYLASRFNHMADEVEENRNRRMYLEKVASWQIIARKLAHEIKNPLTPIQMMVTQLVRRYKGDDEQFRALLEDSKNIISEEVSGLRRMVDNFSQFAQMPQPSMAMKDLGELVRKVVELEKAAFPQHQITYQTNLMHVQVKIDDQLIKQVLINIIKNAAEANQGREAKIEVSIVNTRRHYHIVIHDDGPGIPKELQSRIFEAYFTTKHSGPAPGMGLGLAICQKVMLEHGGDLKVESSPGNTKFFMSLPMSGTETTHSSIERTITK